MKGAIHTRDFHLTDKETAYLLPAKAMAMTVIDLLADGAEKAAGILDGFIPAMTREAYLSLMQKNMNRIEVKNMDI